MGGDCWGSNCLTPLIPVFLVAVAVISPSSSSALPKQPILTHLCFVLLLLLLLQDHIAASKELQTSPTFKLLLSVTLGLGNFVNHGSRLAPAGGFRLKTLNKLHDSKTPDNKQTMLQVR